MPVHVQPPTRANDPTTQLATTHSATSQSAPRIAATASSANAPATATSWAGVGRGRTVPNAVAATAAPVST